MPPETSIVIRTLNEGKNLEKVLQGIHNQNYKNWEIVLVDSGSTDRTLELAEKYGARIFYIPSNEFTFGRSLNQGCLEALGEYLVFVSGHVWPVTNNWLRNLVEPFQEPSVAMVYGRQRGTSDSRLSELHDLQRQFGPVTQILVDEPKGNNGNAAIRKSLWLDQPFDESLPGLEDVDWARKAERNGHRVYYAADAAVYHLHEENLKQVYTRHRREAIASKRMFPHNKFTWSNVILGLPYFILRDVLFAFRQSKLGLLFQIPGNRIAQFLGMHHGMNHQQKLGREVIKELTIPDTHQSIEVQETGQPSLRQSEIPKLQQNEVMVQVAYVAVNHQDMNSDYASLDPSKINSANHPFVFGSEFSGIVVQSDSKKASWKKGQKVAQISQHWWEDITLSQTGRNSADYRKKHHKFVQVSGAYAQYIAVPSCQIVKLPKEMSLLYGVWVPHIASCLMELRKLGVKSGQSICLIGASPLSNLYAQTMVYRGIRVKVVDPDPNLLAVLRRYDIDTGTNLSVKESFDYLIDVSIADTGATQIPEYYTRAVKKIKLRSSAKSVSGIDDKLAEINFPKSLSELDWNEAIRLVDNGTINLVDHTSDIYPLEDYQTGWDFKREQHYYKILLSPNPILEGL